MTLVDPTWRPCSGRQTIEGILFKSYSCGVLLYTQVSDDGTIRLMDNRNRSGHHVEVLGHGWITSARDQRKWHRFSTRAKAVKAALKIMKAKVNA